MGLKRRKHLLRNCKLRSSFMLYMLVFGLLSLVLCGLCISLLENLYWGIAGPYYNSVSFTEEGVLYNGAYFPSISALFSESERVLVFVCQCLQIVCIPVCIVLCIVLAGCLFYRRKLKKPLQMLHYAAARMSQNDLDFQLRPDNCNELGQLCADFEVMRAALEENNRKMWRAMEERKQLNAAFAHDLRTPLTVLHGYTELLQDGTLPPERAAGVARRMGGQIERLEQYTYAMSRLQKLEDVQAEPRPVFLSSLQSQLSARAELLCRQAGRRLAFSSGGLQGQLLLDENLLSEVYDNLVSNAIRYAKETVFVCCVAEGDNLAVTVADDGPGFTREGLCHATDPFYRGDKGGGQHFGLGLNICRLLCTAHQGSLAVANRPGGGARVTAFFKGKFAEQCGGT